MAHLILNSVTFSGLPDGTGNASAWQPTGLVMKERKVGVTLLAADGTRNRVERNVVKREWEITWTTVNLATITSLRAIQRLMSSFTFSDLDGSSFTVQTEDDDFAPSFSFIDRSGVRYYDAALTLKQV
jgi:hypothetical protein